jgi:hypothetical protein
MKRLKIRDFVLLRKSNEQSTTAENETPPKITLDALEKQSRRFNIDLTSKVSRNVDLELNVLDISLALLCIWWSY